MSAYSGAADASTIREDHFSGVSWGAVTAGAFVAAALSLLLLALGAGFELSTVSPWSRPGAKVASVSTIALVWLIVCEIVASGMGGYLAGRLRTKWVSLHTHEVYFRDTAHGFLAWAVAVVVTAAFLGPAASVMVGTAAAENATAGAENARFVDTLFRPASTPAVTAATASGAIGTNPEMRREAGSILTDLVQAVDEREAERDRLVQLVSLATGLNVTDANARVTDAVNRAQQAEAAVRKAGARLLFWTFLALVLGAFCASYAATIGGRQRDHLPAI